MMIDPKSNKRGNLSHKSRDKKKKEKDTDITDEIGGGGEGLTKKGFL